MTFGVLSIMKGMNIKMQNKKVCFLYKNMVMGGAETLILRMSEWLILNNYKVEIVCKSVTKEMEKSFTKKNVLIKKLKYFSANEYIKTIEKENEFKYIYFITFGFHEYFISEKIRFKCKKMNVYNLWYVIHPFHTRIGKGLTFFFESSLRETILNLYQSNRIFFMDEDCIKATEKYYKINLEKAYKNIIRLPLFINKPQKIKTKYKGHLNILSIARFDFPFKGYLIGLVKVFAELSKENPDMNLTIIGDGNGMPEIKKVINSLEITVQNHIYVKGIVPYEELDDYFSNADIYIGMGTTLLDASNHMIPSLTACYYTYDLLITDFFYKQPNLLTGLPKNGNISHSIDLIKKAINMDSAEYENISIKSFLAFSEMYDINLNMPRFLNITLNNEEMVQNILIMNLILIRRKIIEVIACFIKFIKGIKNNK